MSDTEPVESETQLLPWDREPDPCWSCGGNAEARDDIHVRCVDSKDVGCEVTNHWYTRKTWNTRVPSSEVQVDAEDKNSPLCPGCGQQVIGYQRGLLEAAEECDSRSERWSALADKSAGFRKRKFKMFSNVLRDTAEAIRSRLSEPKNQEDHRYNYDQREDGLYVCKGEHPKSVDCEWEKI